MVGIGASAGGLEAVSELLKHLPSKTGMAFVFIQHLEPRQTSRLTDILSRITDMLVDVASDRLRMKRDHIYVMPPGVDITLSDGELVLERRTETAGRHLPVDYFFHSLDRSCSASARTLANATDLISITGGWLSHAPFLQGRVRLTLT